MTEFEYDIFMELIDVFDETRDLIRKQDLSEKTIKYLIDILDKDIEITSKRYATNKKALDIACMELEDFSADFTSKKTSKEEWQDYLINEAKNNEIRNK